MEIIIKKVTVEECCGTYCVYVEDYRGYSSQLKVARIDMDHKDARKQADKFAAKLKVIFGIK